MSDKPHLSGWCSPDCGPRSHATCQDRLDRGVLERCDCVKHGAAKAALTCGNSVESGAQSDPASAATDRGRGRLQRSQR